MDLWGIMVYRTNNSHFGWVYPLYVAMSVGKSYGKTDGKTNGSIVGQDHIGVPCFQTNP